MLDGERSLLYFWYKSFNPDELSRSYPSYFLSRRIRGEPGARGSDRTLSNFSCPEQNVHLESATKVFEQHGSREIAIKTVVHCVLIFIETGCVRARYIGARNEIKKNICGIGKYV